MPCCKQMFQSIFAMKTVGARSGRSFQSTVVGNSCSIEPTSTNWPWGSKVVGWLDSTGMDGKTKVVEDEALEGVDDPLPDL